MTYVDPTDIEKDDDVKEISTHSNNWSSRKLAFFNQIKFPKETPESLRKSTAYYLQKFDLYEQGNTKLGWNWPAFIFGPSWGGYRGLYLFMIIEIFFFMAIDLINILEENTLVADDINLKDLFSLLLLVIYLGYKIFSGRQANLWYIKKVLEKIEKGSFSYKPSLWTMIGILFILGFVDRTFLKILNFSMHQ